MRDPHDVLGIARGASIEEARRAYRRLAFELHPDRNAAPRAAERFHEVWAAYEALAGPRAATFVDHGPTPEEIVACARLAVQAVVWGWLVGGGRPLGPGTEVELDVRGSRVTMRIS